MPIDKSPSILVHFAHLEDPRIDRTKRHKLIDIVVIAICGVIATAETWEDLEVYGRAKYDFFKTFLDLPHGIPSHDTFSRVFAALDPAHFRECFLSWIKAVAKVTTGDIVAIDGKTLRRSFDKASGKKALHMVSAWSSANQLVLGQLAVEEKSNEITAIPKLLDLLFLKDAVVTIDAMGCQKEIAEKIIDKQADYVLSLKGNQGNLFAELQMAYDGVSNDMLTKRLESFHETTDNDHGRLEIRRYWTTSDKDWLGDNAKKWAGLKSIGIAESIVETNGKITTERRYFLTSLLTDAKAFGVCVRSHWQIETCLHWTLDVTFHEDSCRMRRGHSAENFSMLRQIALNLLKNTKTKRLSVKTKRLKAGWDNEYLLEVLLRGATHL